MTNDLLFLFVGYGIVWIGLFGYLVYVTGRIRSVGEDVRELRDQIETQSPEPRQSAG